ncbi:MAG: putative Ig domain-containing protein, partial [Magnetococcus sp. DMHC-1]
AGVAVVANKATSNQGTWQYSADGGNTWTAISTSVTDGPGALALSATTQVRFLPAAGYNGAVPNLVVRAVDDSHAGNWSTGNAPVLVDTSTKGGTSAISATTATIHATVTAVNDAPTFAGELADQDFIQGQSFSYTVDKSDFEDADTGDTLTLSATLDNGVALPTWLKFD